MIPLELEISNFLSYRETAVLDFRGVHLACISGANGAGKSSILDAITWTLFGQSRSKSDDDLVNRTAVSNDEWAEVTLMFELEETIYRISRRRRARKSTTLELQIATELENGRPVDWKTLSEPKIKETQAVIEDILRMNFDSFINASFFLQGKADEFTTKTPSRRKEILAELLGINVWDSYREKVAERRKAQEDQIRLQDARLEEIDEELLEEPERRAAVEEAEAQHKLIQDQLSARELVLTDLRKMDTAVKQQKQQLIQLRQTHEQTSSNLDDLKATISQRESEKEKHQALIDQKKVIEAEHKKWQRLDTAVAQWQEKANANNQFNRQMEPLRLIIAENRTRLEQQIKQLEQEATLVKQAQIQLDQLLPQRETDQKQLAEIEHQISQFDQQMQALRSSQASLQQLEGEHNLWQQEVAQLQREAGRVASLEQEKNAQSTTLTTSQAQIAEITAKLDSLATQLQDKANLEAELNTMKAEQPRLKTEMDEIKEKMDALNANTASTCPLCGQPLTEAHLTKVLSDLKADGKARGDRYRENQATTKSHQEKLATFANTLKEQPALERQQSSQRDLIAKAEARLAEIDHTLTNWAANGRIRLAALETKLANTADLDAKQLEVAKLETAVAEKSSLDKARTTLQERIVRADAQEQTNQQRIDKWTAEGQAKLESAQTQFKGEAFAPEAQAELAKLTSEQAQIEYDEYEHQQAISARDALQEAPEKAQALKQAESTLETLTSTIADFITQRDSQEAILNTQAEQIAQMEAGLAELESSGSDLGQVEQEVNRLREESIQASRRLGSAQQKLDVLADLQKRRDSITDEKKELAAHLQKLKMLEEACGRNGVQALLIEAAIPEIETRANELLDRLTAGRMSVRFQTQKQLKSNKDVKRETLDIHIRDEAGERPYSNFSGGEQFRVNFAIRLALSQILARRAGAKLQTLVIDEGFGSQDPNGRQRLIEAINTIQEDFARILVITHIEELREAFPNQIEVQKTASGSQFSIN
ncbi:MAG: SMC family ATPase [Chloroflexota bacterium]